MIAGPVRRNRFTDADVPVDAVHVAHCVESSEQGVHVSNHGRVSTSRDMVVKPAMSIKQYGHPLVASCELSWRVGRGARSGGRRDASRVNCWCGQTICIKDNALAGNRLVARAPSHRFQGPLITVRPEPSSGLGISTRTKNDSAESRGSCCLLPLPPQPSLTMCRKVWSHARSLKAQDLRPRRKCLY
jgi:hypothetical protein